MKKKRRIANFIMAAVIALIAAAGLFAVGSVRGWFGGAEDAATLCDVRGVVTLTRSGVAYPVEEETALREGDALSFSAGATASSRSRITASAPRISALTMMLGVLPGRNSMERRMRSLSLRPRDGRLDPRADHAVQRAAIHQRDARRFHAVFAEHFLHGAANVVAELSEHH